MNPIKVHEVAWKLQLFCLAGSARIKVSATGLGCVMFDPVKQVWHRAGQDEMSPTAFIRGWGVKTIEVLISRLIRHDAERRASISQQGGAGGVTRACNRGTEAGALPAAFNKARFQGDPPNDGWPVRFVVITAYNPDARIVTQTGNSAADRSLEKHLQQDGMRIFRVIGGSQDRLHEEPGWGFVPPNDEYVVGLCRQYQQLAYFEVVDGAVLLVNALDESCHLVGSWRDLLIGPAPELRPVNPA